MLSGTCCLLFSIDGGTKKKKTRRKKESSSPNFLLLFRRLVCWCVVMSEVRSEAAAALSGLVSSLAFFSLFDTRSRSTKTFLIEKKKVRKGNERKIPKKQKKKTSQAENASLDLSCYPTVP